MSGYGVAPMQPMQPQQYQEPESNAAIVSGVVFFLILLIVASLLAYFLWWVPTQIAAANTAAVATAKTLYPWLKDVTIQSTGPITFSPPNADGSILITITGMSNFTMPPTAGIDVQSNQIDPQTQTLLLKQSTLTTTSLSKFSIIANKSISAHDGKPIANSTAIMNTTPEACAADCLTKPTTCLSFEFYRNEKNCVLQNVKTTSSDVTVVENANIDTYDLK